MIRKISLLKPTFSLVSAIEQELGSLSRLRADLADGVWKACDLVCLTHILLAAAGETVDYRVLGERMIREGLAAYRAAAETFLDKVLHGE